MQICIFNCRYSPCLFLSLALSSPSCEDSCFPSYSTLIAAFKQTIHILPIKQVFCPSMLITGIIWHQQEGVGVFLQLWSVTPRGYNSTAAHTLGRLCSRHSLCRSLSSLSSGNSYRQMALSHPVYSSPPALLLISKSKGFGSSLPQRNAPQSKKCVLWYTQITRWWL